MSSQKMEIEVIANIKQLLASFNNLETRINKVATTAEVGNKRIETSTQTLASTFKKIIGGIGGVLAAIMALKKGFDLAVQAKNAARDATEINSKFNAVFSNIKKQANSMADELARDFGQASSTVRKLLGDTGDLLTGFGYTQEAALKLADRTNRLAIDLASFTNYEQGAEGATSALIRAFTGEREAIKALGIVIREEMVEEELMRVGKNKLAGIAKAQAVAEATLNIAYSQSKNAIGDYVRTQNDLANVERRKKEAQKAFTEYMGNKLVPIFKQANIIATEFFRTLTESDLETTIRRLREMGASVESLTRLEKLKMVGELRDMNDELKKSKYTYKSLESADTALIKLEKKRIDNINEAAYWEARMLETTQDYKEAKKSASLGERNQLRRNYNQFIDQHRKMVAQNEIEKQQLDRQIETIGKNIELLTEIDTLKRNIEDADQALIVEQQEVTEITKEEKEALEQIKYILAQQAGISAEIKYWEEKKAGLTSNDYQTKLKILQIDQKIAALQKERGDIDNLKNSIDYLQLVEGKSLREARVQYMKYLHDKIDAIKENTNEEITEKTRLKLELAKIQDEINREQKEKIKQTNEDIADIITGGGYGAAYETVMQRIKQRMVVWAVQEIKLAAWLEKTKFALKEAWAGRTLAMEQLFSGKEILLNLKTSASNFIAGMTNLFKSVMKIPFPGNVIAFGAGGATVIGLLNSFKNKGQSIIKAAEGALINKPTLALVGEAVARSGPELITPMKTFKQVVNDQIMPELRAKLDSNINFNTKALEDRLERVESAIYATRNTLTERGIAKAVTRTGRRKLS